jgi:hypothetical protein
MWVQNSWATVLATHRLLSQDLPDVLSKRPLQRGCGCDEDGFDCGSRPSALLPR